MVLLNRCFGARAHGRDGVGCLSEVLSRLDIRMRVMYKIGAKSEAGPRSTHYELKWEIPVERQERG